MGFPKILKDQEWQSFQKTNQWHATGSNTASKAAVTDRTHLVTEILVTCSTAGAVHVKSGANILWNFDVTAGDVVHIELAGCPMRCNKGEAAEVVFSTGTGKVNISGITI